MQFLVILLNKKVLCVQSMSDFRQGSRLKECKLELKVPLADSSPTRQKPGMHHRLNLILSRTFATIALNVENETRSASHFISVKHNLIFQVRNPRECVLCLKLLFLKEINGTGKYFLYTHFALIGRSESLLSQRGMETVSRIASSYLFHVLRHFRHDSTTILGKQQQEEYRRLASLAGSLFAPPAPSTRTPKT